MSQPYLEAIRSCDLARLQSVLDDSPSAVHAVLLKSEAVDGTGGCTGLHLAVHCADVEIARLESVAEVDVCAAAILGRIERVRELLDQDPDLVNDRSTNLSPLGWASYGNRTEVAAELISRGAG